MNLTRSQRKEVEQIVSAMECSKDFACRRSKFEDLCQVKDIGLDDVVCLGTAMDRVCGFTTPFEGDYICSCPLRIYIARRLGRS
jgi:hypothetical protein